MDKKDDIDMIGLQFAINLGKCISYTTITSPFRILRLLLQSRRAITNKYFQYNTNLNRNEYHYHYPLPTMIKYLLEKTLLREKV